MRDSSHLGLMLVVCTMLGCTTSSEVGRFDGNDGAAGSAGDGGLDGGPVQLEPVHTRLALGAASSCAIDGKGAVLCWGDNELGQLGIGSETTAGSSTPLSVQGLGSGARAIFGGGAAHCVALNDGHAKCWGDSVFGQFEGFGSVHAIALSPLEAPGLSSVIRMAIGLYFHCALNVEGRVKCYGLNGTGQLGIGSLDDRYTPAGVLGLPDAAGLAAAQTGFFACASTLTGALYCWGSNDSGQLGIDSTEDKLAPTPVAALGSGVTAIAAGSRHACAIVAGGVQCWGSNSQGQLGSGSGPDRGLPTPVGGLPPMIAIAAGIAHTCALSDAGAVYCWGSSDSGSSPGAPTEIVAAGVTELAAGGHHSCALSSDSTLRCWGANENGQLGPFSGTGAAL